MRRRALEAGGPIDDLWRMRRDPDREEIWQVEVLPADGARRTGGPPPRGSRTLGTLALVAALAGGLALLALLVVFAATVALIAIPIALGAAFLAWASMKWRAYAARRNR